MKRGKTPDEYLTRLDERVNRIVDRALLRMLEALDGPQRMTARQRAERRGLRGIEGGKTK